MFTQQELAKLGFFPQTKYKSGVAVSVGFTAPPEITEEIFNNIPQHIQIRYSQSSSNGIHQLVYK